MLTTSAIVAFMLLGSLWLAAVLREHGLRPMRKMAGLMRRPAWEAALLAAVAVGFIHHGATKGTNGVPGPAGLGAILAVGTADPPASSTPAAQTNADWLAFGGHEDWSYLGDGGWCFRFGSNLVERLTVFSCGEISSAPYDASNRISVLGRPLSLVPAANWPMLGNGGGSLFWHAVTPSNSLVLTWQNALVNRDANQPVTVRAELFADGAAVMRYGFSGLGDIGALSNAAARIWRDGEEAAVPLQTGAVAEVAFPAPQITGTNALVDVGALIAGGDSNAYYFADVAVSKGPARITVEADGESTLGSYAIMSAPGVTNRLPFLIGPRYAVSSETAFTAFAAVPSGRETEDSHPVVTNLTDRLAEVQWPVAFALDEVSSAPEGNTYALRVTPDFLNGAVVWSGAATNEPMRGAPPTRSGIRCACGCLSFFEDFVTHSSSCQCDGCSALGDYVYEGHAEHFELPFGGAPGEDPPGPDDPGIGEPPEPESSVSVNAEKSIIFFEDAYENGPGESVARRSTFCKIECNYSAAESGVLAFSVQSGSDRIILHDGSPNGTIVSGGAWALQGGDSGTRTFYAEGVSASAVQGDVQFKATFTGATPDTLESSCSITVVKMTVTANADYPDGYKHRHIFGVCEQVRYETDPLMTSLTWQLSEDATWVETRSVDSRLCWMPDYATTVALTVSGGNESFSINVSCVVPSGIDARPYAIRSISGEKGRAGDIGMLMKFTLMPTNVSFAGFRVSERPSDVGTHTGYFADPSLSNMWYHTTENGAGTWDTVRSDSNYYAEDLAYIGYCEPSWSAGEMSWEIPNAWLPSASYFQVLSARTFLTAYQTFSITANGTVTVGKHGNTVTRTTNDNITVNGVIVR